MKTEEIKRTLSSFLQGRVISDFTTLKKAVALLVAVELLTCVYEKETLKYCESYHGQDPAFPPDISNFKKLLVEEWDMWLHDYISHLPCEVNGVDGYSDLSFVISSRNNFMGHNNVEVKIEIIAEFKNENAIISILTRRKDDADDVLRKWTCESTTYHVCVEDFACLLAHATMF